MIRTKVKGDAEVARLKRIVSRMPKILGDAARRTAIWTQGELIRATPKKWTGMTRKAWQVIRIGDTTFRVENESKVMLFLEEGTKAHGPVTSMSQRPWANDPGNVRHGHERVLRGQRFRAKRLFLPLTRRAALGGWNPGLRYGIDYVLAKKVKGIRARHIVEKQRPKTVEYLQNQAGAGIVAEINK